jgi:hypothetical protein
MSLWGTAKPENGQNSDAVPLAPESTIALSKGYYQNFQPIVKHHAKLRRYAQF